MQPNQITLAVDTANTGTTSNEVYERYEEFQNRSTYAGINHTPAARDTFQLYRTFPTKNGNYRGTQKSSVKFTKDVGVAGVDANTTLAAPLIMELSFSIPVGVAASVVKEARQRLLALLDNDTCMDALNIQLMV